MMENKKIRRILPLCLSAVIAAGATSVVDHITLKGDVPAYAGMFGDVNGDGVVNASDAAVILQFAAWSGAGNDGDLAYYLAQRGIAWPTEEPTVPETVIPTEEVTEPPTEEPTEPPTDPAEEVSDLYAALSAEWAKTGDTSTVDFGERNDSLIRAALYQEKIYFRTSNGSYDAFYVYDVAAKTLTEQHFSTELTNYTHFYFSRSGYWYVHDYVSKKMIKFDLNGNAIGVIDNAEYPIISDNGYVFSHSNTGLTYYHTPDLEKKSYPDCVVKDSHGLDNTISMSSVVLAYGSKCVAYGYDQVTKKYGYYQFDTSTEKWEALSDSLNYPNVIKRVGRYQILNKGFENQVYDTNTDTLIAKGLPEKFGETYFGGTFNIVKSNSTFQRVKAVDEHSSFDWDNAVVIGTDSSTSGSFLPLDDTRYLYTDAAGIFLRTYEKGAEGEELVYRFEQ